MRIAMIGQKGVPASYGGVERHVHDLSRDLVRHGHFVTVYCRKWYTKTTPGTVDGIQTVYLPSIPTKHLDAASHTLVATIHALFQPHDILHYQGVGPALFAWIPRLLRPQKTVIITFHTKDRKNEKWGFFARLCLTLGEWFTCHFAHQVIAVSESLQEYVADVYNTPSVYIPNSVPLYEKTNDTTPLKRWGITSGNYIIMLARLIPLKGAHYLIDAYTQLVVSQPHILAGKKLVIVGDGAHTNHYVKLLKRRAKQNPNIIFTGTQSGHHLASLMSHAAMMVHPSLYEGLPLVVLEGMSYGIPIIVSDIPEHRTLITNPRYRFPSKDSQALAKCLTDILGMSKQDIDAEIQKNRARIQKDFTAEKTIEQVMTLYETTHRERHNKPLSPTYSETKKLTVS